MNQSCTRTQCFVSQNRFLLTLLKIFPRPIYQNWWILTILPPCSTCPWFYKPKTCEWRLSTQWTEYSSAGWFYSLLNLISVFPGGISPLHSCIPLHYSLFACLESVFDQFADLILSSKADLHINSYTNNSMAQAPNYHFCVQFVLNAFSNSRFWVFLVFHLKKKKKRQLFNHDFFFFLHHFWLINH